MSDQQLLAALRSIDRRLQAIEGGAPYLVDGATTGKSFKRIVVQADGTTLTVLTGVDGTNYLTLYNLSGKTLNKGAIITCAESPIAAVTVTAGQVFGYEV